MPVQQGGSAVEMLLEKGDERPGTSNPQNFAHAIVMVEAVHMGILVPRFPLHVRCTRSENRCRGKQTPLQTASVQALCNARLVEEIAHGRP